MLCRCLWKFTPFRVNLTLWVLNAGPEPHQSWEPANKQSNQHLTASNTRRSPTQQITSHRVYLSPQSSVFGSSYELWLGGAGRRRRSIDSSVVMRDLLMDVFFPSTGSSAGRMLNHKCAWTGIYSSGDSFYRPATGIILPTVYVGFEIHLTWQKFELLTDWNRDHKYLPNVLFHQQALKLADFLKVISCSMILAAIDAKWHQMSMFIRCGKSFFFF